MAKINHTKEIEEIFREYPELKNADDVDTHLLVKICEKHNWNINDIKEKTSVVTLCKRRQDIQKRKEFAPNDEVWEKRQKLGSILKARYGKKG